MGSSFLLQQLFLGSHTNYCCAPLIWSIDRFLLRFSLFLNCWRMMNSWVFFFLNDLLPWEPALFIQSDNVLQGIVEMYGIISF